MKKLGFAKKVYLLDWSEESIKLTKALFKKYKENGNFIVGDTKNLPFKDKTFDLVFSGGLLEHFKENDTLRILSEQKRVSKYILTQVPISTPAYWIFRILITLIKFGWPFGYEKPMNKEKLMEMYKKQNIEIIDDDYHDLLTAIKFNIGARENKNFNFRKNFLNWLAINELAVLGKSNILYTTKER